MTSPKPTRSELWNTVFANKEQAQPQPQPLLSTHRPLSFDAFEQPVSKTGSVDPRTNSLAPLVQSQSQSQSQTPKYHNNTYHNFNKNYYNVPSGGAHNKPLHKSLHKSLQVNDKYHIQQSNSPQLTTKQRVQTVLQSKVVVAVIVSVCVLLILLVLNPPFAQKPDDSGKRSAMRILTWSLVFGLLAFVLPMGAGIFSSS
jgi:hypothetical protein